MMNPSMNPHKPRPRMSARIRPQHRNIFTSNTLPYSLTEAPLLPALSAERQSWHKGTIQISAPPPEAPLPPAISPEQESWHKGTIQFSPPFHQST